MYQKEERQKERRRKMSDEEKPDPEAFKAIYHQGSGTMTVDDFVGGSTDNTGRSKFEKKKWTPKKADNNTDNYSSRIDDWAGGGTCTTRGWKAKSPSSSTPSDDGGNYEKPHHEVVGSPTTRRWKPPSKEHAVPPPWVTSPSKPSSPRKWKLRGPAKTATSPTTSNTEIKASTEGVPPAPRGSPDPEPPKETIAAVTDEPSPFATSEETGEMEDPEVYRPDPSEFKQMNDHHEAGGAKIDDFVGSTKNTGRSKFNHKKWTPTKPESGDTAARIEDWAGGTTCTTRGWKVKSDSGKPRAAEKEKEPESEAVPPPKPSAPPPKESDPEPSSVVESEPELPATVSVDGDSKDYEPATESSPTPTPTSDAEVESEEEEEDSISTSSNYVDPEATPLAKETDSSSNQNESGVLYKPDPKEFIQMRNIDEAGGARVDDYVGGGGGGNTGRSKFNKKKWTPTKPNAGDAAARVDDWAGGATCSKRGWKVKSVKSNPSD